MSFSAPPFSQSPDVLGKPQTFKNITLAASSTDVTLVATDDEWILTYISGYVECDQPGSLLTFELDGNVVLQQLAFNNSTAFVFPIQLYTQFVLAPTFSWRISFGPAPIGSTFCTAGIYIAGYRTGLNV